MNIPMVDLKGQYQPLKQEIDSALIEALSVAQNCFSLPIYPELEDETVDTITDIIKETPNV